MNSLVDTQISQKNLRNINKSIFNAQNRSFQRPQTAKVSRNQNTELIKSQNILHEN